MVCFFRYHICTSSRKKLAVLLALGWCLGILLGMYFARSADNFCFSQMHTMLESSVSISGLLTVLSLPFLFTAFAVYISHRWLLIPFSFFKAFSFSYVGTLLFQASGSGGWLLRLMYLFSDCFAALILCWLWLRCCHCRSRDAYCCCVAAGLLLIIVALLDYRYISPFLYNLLS